MVGTMRHTHGRATTQSVRARERAIGEGGHPPKCQIPKSPPWGTAAGGERRSRRKRTPWVAHTPRKRKSTAQASDCVGSRAGGAAGLQAAAAGLLVAKLFEADAELFEVGFAVEGSLALEQRRSSRREPRRVRVGGAAA